MQALEDACFQAATSSTLSALRRSECEDELEWVVSELVGNKLRLADAATALDVEKKKLFDTKQRLHAYAKRVTSLELALANAKQNKGSSSGDSKRGNNNIKDSSTNGYDGLVFCSQGRLDAIIEVEAVDFEDDDEEEKTNKK
jgi:hypothetical protein